MKGDWGGGRWETSKSFIGRVLKTSVFRFWCDGKTELRKGKPLGVDKVVKTLTVGEQVYISASTLFSCSELHSFSSWWPTIFKDAKNSFIPVENYQLSAQELITIISFFFSPPPKGKYAIIGASVSLFLAVLGLAAIFCYFKRRMNHNQRQAADAIGHVLEGIEEPGINNDDSVIRGENSPLLNLADDISQDAKYLKVKKGKQNK